MKSKLSENQKKLIKLYSDLKKIDKMKNVLQKYYLEDHTKMVINVARKSILNNIKVIENG